MANIENATALISIFGKWPSFHDAEVLRAVLDRSGPEGPSVETMIHVFEMTSEIDSKSGLYAVKNRMLVTLRFTEISLQQIHGFNEQNVLSSLEVAELDPDAHEGRHFHVRLASLYGMDAEFECKRLIVGNVQPYEGAV